MRVSPGRRAVADVARPRRPAAGAPRLPAPGAAAAAHDRRRRRHALPLPDGGLVPRAPAARSCACTAGTRAPTSATRCCSTTSRFPFLVMSALAPLTGLPVAFKLGTALGVFLLPLLAYAVVPPHGLPLSRAAPGRRGRARLPLPRGEPDLGRHDRQHAHRRVLLHVRHRLAVLFLGVAVRARVTAGAPWLPARLLALTALAHGYAVLWAGLGSGLLPLRRAAPGSEQDAAAPGLALGGGGARLRAGGAFAGAAAGGLGLDDALRRCLDHVTTRGILPPLLLPLLAAGVVGLAATLVAARRPAGAAIARLLLLGYGALVGAALAAAGPALGIIDVRFVPFAQLALSLCGAAALGWALSRLALADAAALGLVLLAAFYGRRALARAAALDRLELHRPRGQGAVAGVPRADGAPARAAWPTRAWRSSTARCTRRRARSACTRRCPSSPAARRWRASTTRPACRRTPSTTWPRSWARRSPNPFRSREYSSFDTGERPRHLRLFNVAQIVAVSPELASALDARPDVVREAGSRPTRSSACASRGRATWSRWPSRPCARSAHGWRDKAYRWFTRKPANRAHLVFTDDTALRPRARRRVAARRRSGRSRAASSVTERVEAEAIHITTSRPGHPLLVKVSYHPRWRAEGADGPYLVSPGLMMVVPRQPDVRLAYAARTWSDRLGRTLFLAAVGAGLVLGRRRAKSAGQARPERRCQKRAGRARSRRPAGLLRALPLALAAALASLRLPAARRGRRWTSPCSTSGPRAPSPRSAGRRPPSTRATRSTWSGPTTRGGTSGSRCAARRCCGRGRPGSPCSRSRPWLTWARVPTGPRRSSPEPSLARRRATRRARPPGGAACAPTTRARPGPSASTSPRGRASAR